MHDHHTWTIGMIKAVIKGGVVGFLYGISANMWLNYYPNFVW